MNRLRTTSLILPIMLGVILWGGVHAWGAVHSGWSYWRGMKALVIAGCVLLFLGFWALMLAYRRWRLSAAMPTPAPDDREAARSADGPTAVLPRGE